MGDEIEKRMLSGRVDSDVHVRVANLESQIPDVLANHRCLLTRLDGMETRINPVIDQATTSIRDIPSLIARLEGLERQEQYEALSHNGRQEQERPQDRALVARVSELEKLPQTVDMRLNVLEQAVEEACKELTSSSVQTQTVFDLRLRAAEQQIPTLEHSLREQASAMTKGMQYVLRQIQSLQNEGRSASAPISPQVAADSARRTASSGSGLIGENGVKGAARPLRTLVDEMHDRLAGLSQDIVDGKLSDPRQDRGDGEPGPLSDVRQLQGVNTEVAHLRNDLGSGEGDALGSRIQALEDQVKVTHAQVVRIAQETEAERKDVPKSRSRDFNDDTVLRLAVSHPKADFGPAECGTPQSKERIPSFEPFGPQRDQRQVPVHSSPPSREPSDDGPVLDALQGRLANLLSAIKVTLDHNDGAETCSQTSSVPLVGGPTPQRQVVLPVTQVAQHPRPSTPPRVKVSSEVRRNAPRSSNSPCRTRVASVGVSGMPGSAMRMVSPAPDLRPVFRYQPLPASRQTRQLSVDSPDRRSHRNLSASGNATPRHLSRLSQLPAGAQPTSASFLSPLTR